MTIEAMKQARQIIWRYRHETRLGNQPHMIAHEADETLERIDQAIAYAEKQKPVELVSKTPPLYPIQKEGETFSVEYCEIDTQPKRAVLKTHNPLTDERVNQLLDGFDSRIETAHMNNDPYGVGYLTSMRGMFVELCAAHGIKEKNT